MKKILSLVILMVLFAPIFAFAQLDVTAGGGTGLPTGGIVEILTNLMKWLLYLVGILAVIGFAISGIMYLTAAGDDDQIDRAKKAMLMSILGVVVALMGLVILQAIQAMLGGSNSKF